jgi:prepilin-type N-terminal cleavage/methylation domain-containing protein
MRQRHQLYTRRSQRGFTLVELLVVIAIIGILASIVLASLGSSRTSAVDAKIKANLSIIRTQAELYALQSGTNSYGVFNGGLVPALATASSICLTQSTGNLFSDATIKAALVGAQSSSGSVITCYSNGTVWAAAVALRSNAANAWCVDSAGASMQITTATALSAGAHTCQ